MDRDIKVLKDPLNNEVHLPLKFQQVLLLDECIDKDISLVIMKPAIIVLPNESEGFLYHARLVGWEKTVLMKSEPQKDFWLVTECIWSVDPNLMKDLMFKNQFVTF
jgi:hypothetical protein